MVDRLQEDTIILKITSTFCPVDITAINEASPVARGSLRTETGSVGVNSAISHAGEDNAAVSVSIRALTRIIADQRGRNHWVSEWTQLHVPRGTKYLQSTSAAINLRGAATNIDVGIAQFENCPGVHHGGHASWHIHATAIFKQTSAYLGNPDFVAEVVLFCEQVVIQSTVAYNPDNVAVVS